MALTLATATRNAKADAAVDLIDAGTGAGSLQIRSGSRPASANDAATGTLLAEVILEDPAFGAASSGAASLVDPAPVTGAAAGTATWFRVLDGDDATIFDGSVTATGGGGDLTLATTTISVGLTVDITGGTYTQPSGE